MKLSIDDQYKMYSACNGHDICSVLMSWSQKMILGKIPGGTKMVFFTFHSL